MGSIASIACDTCSAVCWDCAIPGAQYGSSSSFSQTDFDKHKPQRRLVKLVFQGAAKSGKTSLYRQYVKGKFFSKYSATVGADYNTRALHFDSRGRLYRGGSKRKQQLLAEASGCTVDLQMWDCGSGSGKALRSTQSSDTSMFASGSHMRTTSFIQGTHIAVFVYDMTDSKSLSELTRKWIPQLQAQCSADHNASVAFLLGTRLDLCVSSEIDLLQRMENVVANSRATRYTSFAGPKYPSSMTSSLVSASSTLTVADENCERNAKRTDDEIDDSDFTVQLAGGSEEEEILLWSAPSDDSSDDCFGIGKDSAEGSDNETLQFLGAKTKDKKEKRDDSSEEMILGATVSGRLPRRERVSSQMAKKSKRRSSKSKVGKMEAVCSKRALGSEATAVSKEMVAEVLRRYAPWIAGHFEVCCSDRKCVSEVVEHMATILVRTAMREETEARSLVEASLRTGDQRSTTGVRVAGINVANIPAQIGSVIGDTYLQITEAIGSTVGRSTDYPEYELGTTALMSPSPTEAGIAGRRRTRTKYGSIPSDSQL